MNLSRYFKVSEFENSETARIKGIDNSIPFDFVVNIVRLHDNILYPLRKLVGCPVKITSGYRCQKLNAVLGGVQNSQHCTGEAADISVVGQTNLAVFNWIRKNCDFDQLILEKVGNSQWVHVSYRFGANRKQCLSFDGKCYKAM